MSKPTRLRLVEQVDLPLVEASAVVAAPRGDAVQVLLVGDRTSVLARAAHGSLTAWDEVDLGELAGWPLDADEPSQLEGVAVDGAGLVALLREDPPSVLLVDLDARRVQATIGLHHGQDHWAEYWADPASRGEGLLLLRGGRLLVVKEKDPPALVEFAPRGSTALGVGADDVLGPAQRWDAPAGDVRYEAVAAWPLSGEAAALVEDVSDLAVDSDGELWLLSDQSRTLARVALPLPADGGGITTVAEAWRLPKGAEKPEGIAWLPQGRVLVVLDLKERQGAGWLLERPDEEQ